MNAAHPGNLNEALRRAFANRRVLVTGHTGFKGAWLCEWLLSLGAQVHGLALDPPTQPNLFSALGLAARMHDHRADIRDAARVETIVRESQPHLVVHMAAQSLVRAGYAQPRETFEVNVQGTVNLLDVVRQRGTPLGVIAVTSDKCYRPSPTPRNHDERDPFGGHDPYSASKGAAEIAVEAFRHSYFPPSAIAKHGVALASVRAGNVIGGGDWAADRLVPDIARAIIAGAPARVRNPRASRPWQHVLDALSGYLLLGSRMLEGRGGEVAEGWNFGPATNDPGASLTAGQVADRFVAAWGKGSWQDCSDPAAPHEAPHLGLSIDKARARLGWAPAWSAANALAATADWYRRVASAGEDARAVTAEQLDAYARAPRNV